MQELHQDQTDDIITRAVLALRELPIPEGPSAATISQTLQTLREVANRPKPALLLRKINNVPWVKTATLLAMAAALLIMCLVIASVGGSSVAFAQVAEKLRAARTFSYEAVISAAGKQEPVVKYRTWFLDPGQMRVDMGEAITIINYKAGKTITLNSRMKTAYVTPLKQNDNLLPANMNLIDQLRSLTGKPARTLGEKEIDGNKVKGFECDVSGDLKFTIWVNAATGDPVSVEFPVKFGMPGAVATLTNFKLDEPLDPAMFNVDPPKGYKVIENPPVDVGAILHIAPAENVTEILRAYAKKSDGEFPKRLDDWGDFAVKLTQGIDPNNKEERTQMTAVMQRLGALSGGYLFSHKSGIDYQYIPGGKLGEKDRVVFWCRDDKSGEYTAVYGDLRVEKIDKEKLPSPENDGKK